MRLGGVDVSSWSKAKENLLRHMFILDLIRDFNKFVSETTVSFYTSPYRDEETSKRLRDIIEKQKKSSLYTIFTAEEKERYQNEIVNTDEAIMQRVARM